MHAFAQKTKTTLETTPAKSVIPGRSLFDHTSVTNSIPDLQRTISNHGIQGSLEGNTKDVKGTPLLPDLTALNTISAEYQ